MIVHGGTPFLRPTEIKGCPLSPPGQTQHRSCALWQCLHYWEGTGMGTPGSPILLPYAPSRGSPDSWQAPGLIKLVLGRIKTKQKKAAAIGKQRVAPGWGVLEQGVALCCGGPLGVQPHRDRSAPQGVKGQWGFMQCPLPAVMQPGLCSHFINRVYPIILMELHPVRDMLGALGLMQFGECRHTSDEGRKMGQCCVAASLAPGDPGWDGAVHPLAWGVGPPSPMGERILLGTQRQERAPFLLPGSQGRVSHSSHLSVHISQCTAAARSQHRRICSVCSAPAHAAPQSRRPCRQVAQLLLATAHGTQPPRMGFGGRAGVSQTHSFATHGVAESTAGTGDPIPGISLHPRALVPITALSPLVERWSHPHGVLHPKMELGGTEEPQSGWK